MIGEEKGTITLKCEASKPTVCPVWRKDGTVLSAESRHELLHDGRILGLTIRDLTQVDAGEYSCDLGTDLTKSKVTIRGMIKRKLTLQTHTFLSVYKVKHAILLLGNDGIKHSLLHCYKQSSFR